MIGNLTIVAGCFPTVALLFLAIAIQNKKLYLMLCAFFLLFFDDLELEVWMLSFQVTNYWLILVLTSFYCTSSRVYFVMKGYAADLISRLADLNNFQSSFHNNLPLQQLWLKSKNYTSDLSKVEI